MIRYFLFEYLVWFKEVRKAGSVFQKGELDVQTHMGKEGRGEQKHREMPGNWSTYTENYFC